MAVSVNEVILTFHAADLHGLPVHDLKLEEIHLLDNGKPPAKILALESMQDYPIRAGLLIDTSESVENDLPQSRAISVQFVQRLLRQRTDLAFVMDFGFASNIRQSWSGDQVALVAGVHQAKRGGENPLAGTALFDSIYKACFYEFGKVDHAASGNVILLFSDGEDNASHTTLNEVVDICQKSNTAVYAFRPRLSSGSFSSGPKNLAGLTQQTGGRVFHQDDSEVEVYSDLQTIEAELRNQYRLVYRPAEFKHDGTFHRIELRGPDRVESISIRSGYYAPMN